MLMSCLKRTQNLSLLKMELATGWIVCSATDLIFKFLIMVIAANRVGASGKESRIGHVVETELFIAANGPPVRLVSVAE